MKRILFALIILLLPALAQAAGGAVHLDKIHLDFSNKSSLQRGMATYVNNCLACHSLKYQRYQRTAEDLEIPLDLMKKHLIPGDQKVGEQITNAMPKEGANRWFGNAPPDLTLQTKLKGSDWVYTYLRSFYRDESRPWGVNNSVSKNVAMPNVLEYLQGVQLNHCSATELANSSTEIDPLTGLEIGGCYSLADNSGEQTKAEFDKTIYDLVNFMSYIGAPHTMDSQSIGIKVLIFLFIFFFFAYALKREYWRDIR